MSFCPQCGAKVADGAKFCSVCGTSLNMQPAENPEEFSVDFAPEEPVFEQSTPAYAASAYAEDQPEKSFGGKASDSVKGPGKWILFGGLGGVALILVVVLVMSLFGAKTPAKQVEEAFAKTAMNVAASGVPARMSDITTSGSAELIVRSDEIDADVTAAFDVLSKTAALTGEIDVAGFNIFEGGLYVNDTAAAVQYDSLLGKPYGLDYTKLAECLPKSIFSPTSGSKYALPEDYFEELMTIIKSQDDSKKLSEDASVYFAKYARLIYDSMFKEGKTETAADAVSVGSKQITTSKITLTLDGPAMGKVFETVAKEMKADDSLKQLLKDLFTAQQMDKSSGFQSAEEFISETWDALENYEETVQELQDSDAVLTLTFHIGKSSGTIVALMEDFQVESEHMTATLILGENPVTSPEVSLTGEYNSEVVTFSRKILEDSSKAYSVQFSLDAAGESAQLTFDWDKAAGKYTLTADVPDTPSVTVKGNLTKDGDTTTMTVDKVMNQSLPVDVSLVLKKGASVKVPEYTDIMAMSEQDVDNLTEEVTNSLTFRMITSLLGSVL